MTNTKNGAKKVLEDGSKIAKAVESNDGKTSVDELIESMNGFEEMAIDKAFGAEIYDLLATKPIRGLRACLFLVKKREGLNDVQAHQAAMATSLKNLNEQFEYVEEDEDIEDPKDSEPESEQE